MLLKLKIQKKRMKYIIQKHYLKREKMEKSNNFLLFKYYKIKSPKILQLIIEKEFFLIMEKDGDSMYSVLMMHY